VFGTVAQDSGTARVSRNLPGVKWRRDQAPVLALDIDGVISLFGFEQPDTPQGHADPTHKPPGDYHLVDGMLHCINTQTGPQINRLAQIYEVIWASGWEDKANQYLPQILGVPEFRHLTFDGRARFGTAHWKLDAIEEFAGDRALAWVDDSLDRSCYEWAEAREAPTLLVPTDSAIGMTETHVGALEAWPRDAYAAQ
jgi:hypothetical protein